MAMVARVVASCGYVNHVEKSICLSSRVAGTMVACLSSLRWLPFKSEGEVTGCEASCQEVSRCSTRGGSQGIYITFASAKVNKAEPTLVLKPIGEVTRNPKQDSSGPKKGHVYVSAKKLLKKHLICTDDSLLTTVCVQGYRWTLTDDKEIEKLHRNMNWPSSN